MGEGHALFKTDLPKAIENYNMSIELNKANREAYYWRGVAYSRLNNFDSALSDFNAAIAIDPRHFESYLEADRVLAKGQQWEKIIDYWNRFLELEPNHAGAYMERSGARYHNKDLENAVKDLQKSCELGNKAACKQYEKVKGKP